MVGKPLKPADIPNDPAMVYKGKGWVYWGDFLGTDRKPRKPKSRKP